MRYTLAEGSIVKRLLPNDESIVGKRPDEILVTDTLQFLLPLYQRILSGESFNFERKDAYYVFQSYASPIKDDDGQIIGGMILSHDVTESKRTEAALRASETRFHSLVDLAPAGIVQTDVQGKRVFCNSHWCEMTGLTLEQALSDDSYQTIHPDDWDVSGTAWKSMMDTHLPFENVVFRYRRPDGTSVWISGNGRPLYDGQGVVTGYLGVVTNIDQQVSTQATLHESEARYRSVINAMSEGVVLQGQDGTIQASNPAAELILGLTADQMMGRTSLDPLWRAIHEDGSPFPGETRPAKVTLCTGKPLSNIIMGVYNSDNSLRWVSTNSRPIFTNDTPLPSSVVITFTDITEVRGAQEKLRQERDLLRTLIDNMPDYIFLKDTQGRYVLSNTAHAQAGNLTPDNLIGKTAFDVFPSELASQFHADDLALMQSGESLINVERETVDAHANNKIVLTTKIPWRDSSGQILGLVGISRDITERKRMENSLRQNEERLRIITDNSLDLITQSDVEGRFVFVSPSYRAILGYEPELLLGMNSLELVHADDHAHMVQTAITALESSTRQFTLEFQHTTTWVTRVPYLTTFSRYSPYPLSTRRPW
ncbi:MAG: PAS domain S-box protein, partial [Chloroflexota bacterium]